MKVQSNTKLPLIVYELRTNLLNFNETEKTITPETGESFTMWEYDSYRVEKPMLFNNVVVTMIRDKYSENDEAKFARWNLEVNVLKSKILTDAEVAELEAYSDYVQWCHQAARQVV